MEQQIQLNDHNKQEYPPMHTAEHLLNATMVKTFGCPRSRNAHIERKKSKCDYILSSCPTAEQIQSIEDRVNEVISQNLPVTVEFMTHEQAKDIVDLSKLPADASETLRIVRIGDYDACACIGLQTVARRQTALQPQGRQGHQARRVGRSRPENQGLDRKSVV